jgi:hypothetical protein
MNFVTVTVPLADAAPAVAVIADEVDIDEDTEEEVEEEDEEVLVELGAAADVPGKLLSGMAWNVASVRGFWQKTDSVVWISATGP